MQAWHCVQTKPSQELRASVELTKQGFEVYYPLDQSQAKPAPLFARYIFSRFDRDVDNWGLIRSTRGCCDVLRTGFRPAIVRQSLIDAIMAYTAPEPVQDAYPVFLEGQTVRITNGLLQGHEALFRGTNKQRTTALLEFMGVSWKVPITDLAQIA